MFNKLQNSHSSLSTLLNNSYHSQKTNEYLKFLMKMKNSRKVPKAPKNDLFKIKMRRNSITKSTQPQSLNVSIAYQANNNYNAERSLTSEDEYGQRSLTIESEKSRTFKKKQNNDILEENVYGII